MCSLDMGLRNALIKRVGVMISTRRCFVSWSRRAMADRWCGPSVRGNGRPLPPAACWSARRSTWQPPPFVDGQPITGRCAPSVRNRRRRSHQHPLRGRGCCPQVGGELREFDLSDFKPERSGLRRRRLVLLGRASLVQKNHLALRQATHGKWQRYRQMRLRNPPEGLGIKNRCGPPVRHRGQAEQLKCARKRDHDIRHKEDRGQDGGGTLTKMNAPEAMTPEGFLNVRGSYTPVRLNGIVDDALFAIGWLQKFVQLARSDSRLDDTPQMGALPIAQTEPDAVPDQPPAPERADIYGAAGHLLPERQAAGHSNRTVGGHL
jgi:hypothetical protein